MPDVWATFTELDADMQGRLAGVLETRGADAQQQELRRAFLESVPFPRDSRVLEVGCGTGVLTRLLARVPEVGSVVGTDVAPALLERARELASGLPGVSFEEADARDLQFEDASFDVVVFDSVLSHIPGPAAALAETFRVLRPGGRLAAFDGDYATTTVALGEHDPLQRCVDAMMAGSVTDRWVMRRLPAMVADAGFEVDDFRSHGFVAPPEGGYMLTIVDRGADVLAASGQIGPDAAEALKAEARRRVDQGAFFGHIAYAALVAVKLS
jgi:ubiquinone/menaquinone biosynthesis C-methylase UbiE